MNRIQSTELQIKKFCSKPMGENVSVLEVPGVGRMLKKQLEALDIKTTADIFNLLKKYDFDEKKFSDWIGLYCGKRVRVPVIYQALVAWQKQFGDGQPKTPGSEKKTNPAPAKPESHARSSRGIRSTPAPAAVKRQRNSIQFKEPKRKATRNTSRIDSSDSSMDDYGPLNDDKLQPTHELIQFIGSCSSKFTRIPEEFHVEFMQDIIQVIAKYDSKVKLKEKTSEPQPSTSGC